MDYGNVVITGFEIIKRQSVHCKGEEYVNTLNYKSIRLVFYTGEFWEVKKYKNIFSF